jgi:hypothetical protein
MASFWDLLPASPWVPRPYSSPFDQTPLPAPPDRAPSLPPLHELTPQRPPSASSLAAWPGPSHESEEALPTIVSAPTRDVNPLGGILGALFGARRDNASSSAAQEGTQYGVVPKNFPAEYRLPPPVSDWQKPESDFTFTIDSPHTLALVQKSLAAGLPPDRIVLNDSTARLRRDNARMADLLFPGSGNFVSGDWNNITGDDVANLALSLATTFVPPGRAAGPTRAAIRSARAAAEADAAAAAARSVAARGISARAAAPLVGKLNAPSPAPTTLELTGQNHHGISKPTHDALEDHSILRGLYQHRDPRFVTQAIDMDAHRGYQQWHRDLDAEIAAHIRNRPKMTPEAFEEYLRKRYMEPDLIARFPNGL